MHPFTRRHHVHNLILILILSLLIMPLWQASTARAATVSAASDAFGRTVTAGWGTADAGGPWTVCTGTCASYYSVGSGVGKVSLAAGKGTTAALSGYSASDTDLLVSASVDRLPVGSGSFTETSAIVRGTRNTGYLGTVSIASTGSVTALLERSADAATKTVLASAKLPAGTVAAGTKLMVRVQAVGVSPTTLRMRVWKSGTTEPSAWTVSTTDTNSTLQKAGAVGLWSYVAGSVTNGPAVFSFDDLKVGATTTTPDPAPAPAPEPPATSSTGARLPVTYSLSSLTGTVRYVSPTGSDSGAGTLASPFKTVTKAESVSANGDTIVLRGGTYPIANNVTYVDRSNLTIIAYPGETPVFDGSIAAPTSVSTDGSLRYFSYQPIASGVLPDGIALSSLPVATFSGTSPSGLTAERGWRCVSGSSYSTPAPTSADPDGCSGSANLITGYYPDQVWVNGKALQQVSDKSRVATGRFWVSRTSSTDASPGVTSLYLSSADAADMSKVRVSSSKGTFLQFAAAKDSLVGVKIVRHSPSGGYHAVVVGPSAADFVMRDVLLDNNHGVNIKVAGGDSSDGSQLVRRPTFDHITVSNSTFMGMSVSNTDDFALTNSLFTDLNAQKEFKRSPVSGAVKSGRVAHMVIADSVFQNVWGHTLWWDMSSYDVTVADNKFYNNAFSSILFEISHGLTVVNNYIQGPSVGAGEGGHSTVRVSGSSGVRLVNNTILGGSNGVGVFADIRSKKYDSNGDGTADRYCSEHTVRYGKGGDSGGACNAQYSTDFNYSHPGAYAANGVNQTPGMNWMPQVEMMVNNVIANQGGAMAEGWTPCGGKTPLCAYGYVTSPAIDVGMKTVFPASSVIDGNVYQTSGSQIVWLNSPGASAATGTVKAADLAALKGTSGFGSSYYGKSVEAHGRSGSSGFVNADGTATATLKALNGQAAAVPTDAKINKYVAAGSRNFGYVG